jgi:hypothetical protein
MAPSLKYVPNHSSSSHHTPYIGIFPSLRNYTEPAAAAAAAISLHAAGVGLNYIALCS